MISIEELKMCEQTEAKLAKVCWEWAKQNLDDSWQLYAGWEIIEDELIRIYYTYSGIINNVEFEDFHEFKLVSWQDIVEFAKTLEL